jgi:hypothetical protein
LLILVRQASIVGRSCLAGPLQRLDDLAEVVAVHSLGRPAGGLEAGDLVAGLGDGGFAVDGGVVIVEEHGQLVQAQATCERNGLMADSLHQAAVAGDHPGAVIDQPFAETGVQVALRHGHADGGGEALAQRAGGGLHAGGVAVLGVAGGERAPLPEVAELVHRHRLDAVEVQQGVEQHGAVAGAEHEAIAVGPERVGGVELERPGPQRGGDIRHAHRHPLVPRPSAVDRVHAQHTDGVGHALGRRLGHLGRGRGGLVLGHRRRLLGVNGRAPRRRWAGSRQARRTRDIRRAAV